MPSVRSITRQSTAKSRFHAVKKFAAAGAKKFLISAVAAASLTAFHNNPSASAVRLASGTGRPGIVVGRNLGEKRINPINRAMIADERKTIEGKRVLLLPNKPMAAQPVMSREAAVKRLPLYKALLKNVRPSDRPTVYKMIAADFSRVYGVNPALSIAVMRVESDFNPGAISRKNARGLMQIVSKTGNKDIRRLKLRKIVSEPKNPNLHDPLYNIDGGISYLKFLCNCMENLENRNPQQSLKMGVMAYNAGYKGVISGTAIKSGERYFGDVWREYRELRKINPLSFEQELKGKYPKFFEG